LFFSYILIFKIIKSIVIFINLWFFLSGLLKFIKINILFLLFFVLKCIPLFLRWLRSLFEIIKTICWLLIVSPSINPFLFLLFLRLCFFEIIEPFFNALIYWILIMLGAIRFFTTLLRLLLFFEFAESFLIIWLFWFILTPTPSRLIFIYLFFFFLHNSIIVMLCVFYFSFFWILFLFLLNRIFKLSEIGLTIIINHFIVAPTPLRRFLIVDFLLMLIIDVYNCWGLNFWLNFFSLDNIRVLLS